MEKEKKRKKHFTLEVDALRVARAAVDARGLKCAFTRNSTTLSVLKTICPVGVSNRSIRVVAQGPSRCRVLQGIYPAIPCSYPEPLLFVEK